MKELDDEFKRRYSEVEILIRKLVTLIKEKGMRATETAELLAEVIKKVYDLRSMMAITKADLRSSLKLLRHKIRYLEPEKREEVAKQLKGLEKEVENFMSSWDNVVRDLIGTTEEVFRDIRRMYRSYIRRYPLIGMYKGLRGMIRRIELPLTRLEEGPSQVVSSIRLPSSDLEIIDLLVEAGIFKSRSEAVAFFTHKGIESSRPLFEELLEKLHELRDMREQIRRKIEEFLKKEEATKEGEQ